MANFCGGIKLNTDTFEVRNGVITLVDAHSDDPLTETITPCGQLYDALIFETVKHNGKWLVTSAGVDTDIPITTPIKSNCGIYFDSRFFSKDNSGVLDFTDRHLLEVLVSPADVDYTITVGLTSGGELVKPFAGLENVYPMDSIDEEYTVTVTAEGYEEFTQNVTADSDQIVQATLTPTEP